MNLTQDKAAQAIGILGELDIDLWLIFVRETNMMADPTMALVVGHAATWQSFFAFSRAGEAVALVGNHDEANFRRAKQFTEVLTYTQDVKADLVKMIKRLDPKSIAINYSVNDVASDGLTHGMYLLLREYLEGTPYVDRLISSEQLVSKLRSRKLPGEIELIAEAARQTVRVWERVVPMLRVGMSEVEVGGLIDREIAAMGGTPSFDTIVNAGDKTSPGHGAPTSAKLAPGDLLHVDFGIRLNGYCSDLQRLAYFRRTGETKAPPELIEAFETVRDIITETGCMAKPGVRGFEVDAQAREMLRDNGYPEYQHALGHFIGRDVHDGGGILGPKWERYGTMPMQPLEVGNVTTLELEILLPGIGCVGLEEDAAITKDGAEYLCPRQMELIVL